MELMSDDSLSEDGWLTKCGANEKWVAGDDELMRENE